MKIDGITLTDAQTEACRKVAMHPKVVKARKVITLYKYGDANLARFRLEAGQMIEAITVRAVLNRPLRVKQKVYVLAWLADGNDMFRVFFRTLNEAVGREFIEGIPQ